jgi:hypothetical protein
MNRDVEKQARADSGAGPHIVDLRSRVAGMDDKALTTLLENAERLATGGTKQQQTAASDLIPVVKAELAGRAKGTRATVAVKPLGRAPKAR